jgi:small subunit ribosomal protein S14
MPLANILRDKLARLLVAQREPEYQALKLITRNKELPLTVRLKAQLELQKFPRYARAVSVRNRCIIHGKTGVCIFFNLNPMVFVI